MAFFAWIRVELQVSGVEPTFSKALVQQDRSALLAQGLSSVTINLRLSPIRKLIREITDNQLLEPVLAAAIERLPGVERRGNRLGNWLMKELANALLNAPSSNALTGIRGRAILALQLGCRLRRAELLRIELR